MSETDIPAPIEVIELNEKLAEFWNWCIVDEYISGRMESETATKCAKAVGTVQGRADVDRIRWEISNSVIQAAEESNE